jgi:hypothetical protein
VRFKTPLQIRLPIGLGAGLLRKDRDLNGILAPPSPEHNPRHHFEYNEAGRVVAGPASSAVVPETQAWYERRAQDRMHEYMGGSYGHTPGSPGVYRRILPPRAF